MGCNRAQIQLEVECVENNYTKYKTYIELKTLACAHDASDFGRVNQALLAIAFQKSGFLVSHFQGTGRPDFIADRDGERYAIEVKAPVSEKVSLTKDDIVGVELKGHRPILAILTYPSPESRWLFIEANKISPKVYRKNELVRFSISDLEEQISPSFLSSIIEHKNKAMIGASSLQSLVESKSK